MASTRPDYWYFKNVFTKSEVKEIDNFARKNFDGDEPEQHAAKDHDNNKIKNVDTKLIYWGKIKHLLGDLENLIIHTNDNHFGYSVYPLRDKDFINYNLYSSKTKGNYGWHIDQTTKQYKDMKLTCLINISTKQYKGCSFHIFNSCPYIVNEFTQAGDVLVFRSYLNHMVMPVESGERKTLALFMEGPLMR